MLSENAEAINSLNVTMTPTIYVVGLVAALAVQFIKAIVNRWPAITPEIKKPLMPLIGIGLSCLALGFAGIENWPVAGVLTGLASGGGYDLFKGTSALSQPKA